MALGIKYHNFRQVAMLSSASGASAGRPGERTAEPGEEERRRVSAPAVAKRPATT